MMNGHVVTIVKERKDEGGSTVQHLAQALVSLGTTQCSHSPAINLGGRAYDANNPASPRLLVGLKGHPTKR